MICKQFGSCIADCEKNGNVQGGCVNHKQRSDCILSSDCRGKITCSDEGKRYTLVNTKGNLVVNFHMDGGVVKQDKTVPERTNKCDNVLILSNHGSREAILVELKGEDISKALKQLLSTCDLFEPVFSSCTHIYARCVSRNSIPRLQANPSYVKLVTKLGARENYKCLKPGVEERDDQLGT